MDDRIGIVYGWISACNQNQRLNKHIHTLKKIDTNLKLSAGSLFPLFNSEYHWFSSDIGTNYIFTIYFW